MPDRTDLWYRLGYALESARLGQVRATLDARDSERPAASVKDARSSDAKPARPSDVDGLPGSLDLLLAVGTGSLLTRVLRFWPGRGRPTPPRLLRAAVAGMSATALRGLLLHLLARRPGAPEPDDALVDRLLAGAARGLLHAGIVEPRLPGPPVLRGVAYGAGEYLLAPWGGLRGVVGHHAPWRRLPFVSPLLDHPQAGEDSLMDHVVFGLMLGLLYGDDESSTGIDIDER